MKIFSALCVFFISLQVHAMGFELAGAVDYSSPGNNGLSYSQSANASTSSNATAAFGGGLFLEPRLGAHTGLEVGALYLPRNFSFTSSGTGISLNGTVTSQSVEIPLLIRFYVANFFSLGIGGYYAFGFGSTYWTGFTNGTGFYGTASNNNTGSDYGMAASACLGLPLSDRASLIIDARYTYAARVDNYPLGTSPITGTSTVSMNATHSDIIGLVGFRFGI